MKRIYVLLFAMLASVAVFAPVACASVQNHSHMWTFTQYKAEADRFFGPLKFKRDPVLSQDAPGPAYVTTLPYTGKFVPCYRKSLGEPECMDLSIRIERESTSWYDVYTWRVWVTVGTPGMAARLVKMVRAIAGKKAAAWVSYREPEASAGYGFHTIMGVWHLAIGAGGSYFYYASCFGVTLENVSK